MMGFPPLPVLRFFYWNEPYEHHYWMKDSSTKELRFYKLGVDDGIVRLMNSFSSPLIAPIVALLALALPLSILFIATPPADAPGAKSGLEQLANQLNGFYSYILLGLALALAFAGWWKQSMGARLSRWSNYLDMLISDRIALEAQESTSERAPSSAMRPTRLSSSRPARFKPSKKFRGGFNGPR